MNTTELYGRVCLVASRAVTHNYSTSFSLGVRSLHPRFRDPIHSIYGFVRLADEIVDTFHMHDKRGLLERFTIDTWRAIEEGISLNPILHAFQRTVHDHRIDRSHIETFLRSMTMDLDRSLHDTDSHAAYVLGSAEVVGLMCLRVLCGGDEMVFDRLKEPAMRLGAAFQKVNFLRDLKDDHAMLGRSYFPSVRASHLGDADKAAIEREIAADLQAGFEGIKGLPREARFGVYVAYRYYKALFRRIRSVPGDQVTLERIRVPNSVKATLLMKSYLRHSLNML